jgi:hypothetical protein
VPTHVLASLVRVTEKFDLDGEVVSEEDAEGAGDEQPTRVLARRQEGASPVLRGEVKTAAIAAAGGALAGAATVAAVRVVGSAVGSRSRSGRRLSRRRDRGQNVVASRSFLVDVHLLGR